MGPHAVGAKAWLLLLLPLWLRYSLLLLVKCRQRQYLLILLVP